jgi:two-component system, sensor histidine kinase and response regulator
VAASPGSPPPYPQQRADHGSRVLVVEDVPVTLEFLRRLLTDSGYQVILAATAGEAMAALDRELPDLVVLDLLLPDVHGLEVCRHLRRCPEGEDIPVLVITVDDRADCHAQAVQAGADDFLRKPLVPVELQTRARSLLRLRRLRAELRRDRDAILSLQAQKEALLQFVVHDLKNMLGSLLGSVDLMEPGPTLARHRSRIEETLLGMQSMVQSMLDLSVHDQAGLVPRPARIQLESWLPRLRQELDLTTRRADQSLVFEVEPELELEADPQLLHRALFNLLQNASKFSPTGSAVRLRAFRTGTALRFEVSDRGEGIPADMKSRIFDRFVRLEGRAGDHAGRGLGLAFCQLVTELHGGRIWVEDNAPGGSRFVLELPADFEGARD